MSENLQKPNNIAIRLITQLWDWQKKSWQEVPYALEEFSGDDPDAGSFYKFIAGIGGAADYSFAPKGLPDDLDEEHRSILSEPGSFGHSYLEYYDMLCRVKAYSKYRDQPGYTSIEMENYDMMSGNYINPYYLPPIIESSSIEGIDYIIRVLSELVDIENSAVGTFTGSRIVFAFYRE